MVCCFLKPWPPFSRRLVQLRDRVVVPCFPCSSAWWSKTLQVREFHRAEERTHLISRFTKAIVTPDPEPPMKDIGSAWNSCGSTKTPNAEFRHIIEAMKHHETILTNLIFFSSKPRLHSTTIPVCLRSKQSFELKSSLGCFFLLRIFFTWSKKGAGTSVCPEETRWRTAILVI